MCEATGIRLSGVVGSDYIRCKQRLLRTQCLFDTDSLFEIFARQHFDRFLFIGLALQKIVHFVTDFNCYDFSHRAISTTSCC